MRTLIILNDPPYGTERTYNGLRLGINLLKMRPDTSLSVFLFGDATASARAGQRTPDGYYNVERMLSSVIRRGGWVGVCGACMDARGLDEASLVAGAQRSTLDALTELTAEADQVLVF